jgi:hypothetical protein
MSVILLKECGIKPGMCIVFDRGMIHLVKATGEKIYISQLDDKIFVGALEEVTFRAIVDLLATSHDLSSESAPIPNFPLRFRFIEPLPEA